MCPGFHLRVPPRVGANRCICITVFYLRKPGKITCVLVLTCACPRGYVLTGMFVLPRFACGIDIYDDWNIYVIRSIFENDEDKG